LPVVADLVVELLVVEALVDIGLVQERLAETLALNPA
jgi:hypothetical protein